MTPARIQRRREKGWKMPEGAVYVGRGSKWGNPYRVSDPDIEDADHAVEMFKDMLNSDIEISYPDYFDLRVELHAKNLACWCRLCERHRDGLPLGEKCEECAPCHADVLLKWANR